MSELSAMLMREGPRRGSDGHVQLAVDVVQRLLMLTGGAILPLGTGRRTRSSRQHRVSPRPDSCEADGHGRGQVTTAGGTDPG